MPAPADPKPPKDQRIPIMMSEGEVEAIDRWRYENKIPTRSEAIRRLCFIALQWDEHGPTTLETIWEAFKLASKLSDDLPGASDGIGSKPISLDLVLKCLTLYEQLTTAISSGISISEVAKPLTEQPDWKAALEEAARKKAEMSAFRQTIQDEIDDTRRRTGR